MNTQNDITATITYSGNTATVSYSDGRESVTGTVGDRNGAPSPDAWLTGGLERVELSILRALAARDATAMVADPKPLNPGMVQQLRAAYAL